VWSQAYLIYRERIIKYVLAKRKRVTALLGRSGPHGIFWVRGVRGEVAEGLAVVEPGLFGLFGRVGEIRCKEVIRLGDAFIALGAEFLPPFFSFEFYFFRLKKFFSWSVIFVHITPYDAVVCIIIFDEP
jgi:hypothetical protein